MAVLTKTDWSKITEVTRDFGTSTSRLTARLDAVDHRDGVDVTALLENRQIDGALSVDAHDVGLDLRGVARLTDVAHHHRRAADGLERQPVDLGDGVELTVGVDVVVERPDDHVPGRQDQVRVVDRAHDVHHAQLVGLELERIDIDHDLPIASAERLRNRGAGHIGHLIAHVELTEVSQLRSR